MSLPEEIYVWRYTLRSVGSLNARSERREFEGALIRVRDGYGCLHPWPELGDPSLEKLLKMLADGEGHRLIRRALACVAMDRQARNEGYGLLDRLAVPDSHATIVEWNHGAIEEAVGRGFRTVKLKAGREMVGEARLLGEWVRQWPTLRWRLDFNGSPGFEAVREFLQCLMGSVLRRFDFLEDPCRFDAQEWLALREVGGVRLAMDEGVGPGRQEPDLLVLKPAVVDPRDFVDGALECAQGLVVTSAMDHPVGQCFAAVEAGRLMESRGQSLVGTCGLQTHGLFEKDAFSERLGPVSPGFGAPGGTGLGFNEILEELPWKRLQ